MAMLNPYITSLEALSRTSYNDKPSLYQSFVDLVMVKTHSDLAYISFYSPESGAFNRIQCSGDKLNSISNGQSISTTARDLWAASFNHYEPVINNDLGAEIDENTPCQLLRYRHHVNVALRSRLGQIIGVLGIARSDAAYEQKDAQKLSYLVHTAWRLVNEKSSEIDNKYQISIDQFEAISNQDVLLNLIGAISKALELRDAYTSNHMRNVSVISGAIARELQLDENVAVGLQIGSMLHDIGKIALPAEILNKPGLISDVEFELLKTHTTLGALMFENIAVPWPIRDMILEHHERIDGSGYPFGKSGHEICMEAKIIAVADTFDAMSTNRPYRYAPGPQAAMDTILKDRGIKYDSYVVDAFLTAHEKDPTFSGTYGFNSKPAECFKN